MVMWFAKVIWEQFFLKKILKTAAQRPTKVHFFYINKIMGDYEWLRMTNAFILCDLVWKVQKRHAVNRESSFNLFMQLYVVIKMVTIFMFTYTSPVGSSRMDLGRWHLSNSSREGSFNLFMHLYLVIKMETIFMYTYTSPVGSRMGLGRWHWTNSSDLGRIALTIPSSVGSPSVSPADQNICLIIILHSTHFKLGFYT